jgi:hypothetical protein
LRILRVCGPLPRWVGEDCGPAGFQPQRPSGPGSRAQLEWNAHGDRLLRGYRRPACLAVVGDEVLHGGHGEGEDETGEPFLGACGSGTLPARVGGDGTTATSSTSGLRTGATAGTYAGRRRRVSGGVSAETTTAPDGTAHLARRRQATAASVWRSDSAIDVARSDTGPVGSGTGGGGFGPGCRDGRVRRGGLGPASARGKASDRVPTAAPL